MRYTLMLLAASAAAGCQRPVRRRRRLGRGQGRRGPGHRDPGEPDRREGRDHRHQPELPLQLRSFGGRTIVDGDLDRRIRDCHGIGERRQRSMSPASATWRWSDMPQIVIRTPRATWTSTPAARSGARSGARPACDLGNAGCGDWTVANVEGRMRRSARPAPGDTRAGSAGEAKVRVAGSGDTSDRRGPRAGRQSTSPAPAT